MTPQLKKTIACPLLASLVAIGVCFNITGTAYADSQVRLGAVAIQDAISNRARGRLHMRLQRASGVSTIKISTPGTITANAFELQGPPRLVIDIAGLKTSRSSNLEVKSDPFISGLRLGAHSDKVRLVIDLSREISSLYNFTTQGNEATLTIGRATQATSTPTPLTTPTSTETPAPTTSPIITAPTEPTAVSASTAHPTIDPTAASTATPEPTATSSPTSTPTSSPTATPTLTPTTAPTAAPTRTPTQTPTVAPTAIPSLPPATPSPQPAITSSTPPTVLLTAYRFEYLEPGKIPILKIALSRPRANAKIGRVGPREYKIIIPSGGIAGKSLDLPQFPPADFLGFVMVSAKALGDRLEITVNVEQGVTLGTFVKQNEIWVKRLQ